MSSRCSFKDGARVFASLFAKSKEQRDDSHYPFSAATGRKLILIAEKISLVPTGHNEKLPPSWRTLYELTRLTSERLSNLIESGTVHPDRAGAKKPASAGFYSSAGENDPVSSPITRDLDAALAQVSTFPKDRRSPNVWYHWGTAQPARLMNRVRRLRQSHVCRAIVLAERREMRIQPLATLKGTESKGSAIATSTLQLNRHKNTRRAAMSVRLAQEKPKFYEAYLRGKYKSITAASIAAGLQSADVNLRRVTPSQDGPTASRRERSGGAASC